MIYKVLKYYKSPDRLAVPIELIKGDTVKIGEMSDPDGENPNWVFCTSDKTGLSGWVSADILIAENGIGTAVCDYTSKEMTVYAGDAVEVIYKHNGWAWCERLSDGEKGWVLLSNLAL